MKKPTNIMKSRGNEEGSYNLLAGYMHLLQQENRRTKHKLEYITKAKCKHQLKYVFLRLGHRFLGTSIERKQLLWMRDSYYGQVQGWFFGSKCKKLIFRSFQLLLVLLMGE